MTKAENNLRKYQGQLDEEGVIVSVSRQALNEVLDGNESKDKEIQDLEEELKEIKEMAKLNSTVWKMDSDELKNKCNALKKQLERSQAAHEKQVHQMSGEINRQINKVADAERKIQDLEAVVSLAKKALDADTNHFGELETRAESLHEYIERTRKLVESRPKWKRGNG